MAKVQVKTLDRRQASAIIAAPLEQAEPIVDSRISSLAVLLFSFVFVALFAAETAAWLDWQLKDDKEAAKMFTGDYTFPNQINGKLKRKTFLNGSDPPTGKIC